MSDAKKFQEDALASHNAHRKLHGASPLVLADDLSKFAQAWAEHVASSGKFQHSDCTLNGTRIGENIASKWSSGGADLSGEDATKQWYSEESKYNYQAARFESGTGHFTQVVWKASKEMGIGKAVAKNGWVYVVANYRPAGNMQGEFAANVGQKQC